MKIELWYIGKNHLSFYDEQMKVYGQRIEKFSSFTTREFPSTKDGKNKSRLDFQNEEEIKVLQQIKPTDYLVLLDNNGKEFTSEDFSKKIESLLNEIPGRLLFLIGGAYGFSENMYKRKNQIISLSKMTFTHQMVRVIFIEQLYRAFTIINKHSYHH